MRAPTIVIVTAAAQVPLNRIWEAMGRGPDTFSVRLCADVPEATYESPVTHYLMCDMSAMQNDLVVWAAMAENNDLPPLPNGVIWGENGVISALDAQAAINGGNMFVFPAYGLQTQQDKDNWLAGALAALSLRILPDEPV